MGEEIMNDQNTVQLFAALLQWVQSATVRIAALESILKQHLNLSKEELELALAKASADFPLAIGDTPEPFDEVLAFLKNATKAQ